MRQPVPARATVDSTACMLRVAPDLSGWRGRGVGDVGSALSRAEARVGALQQVVAW